MTTVINIRELPDDTRLALLRYGTIVSNEYQFPLIYIGRPAKWGNPFVIGEDGTREEVIEMYREWAEAEPMFIEAVKAILKDKVLVCWCKPRPCHGDVLAELAGVTTDKD